MVPQKKIFSEEITTTTDHQTGEIISTSRSYATRVEQTPDFVMVFTNDIGFMSDISGGASKLLWGLLRFVDRNNEITLNKARKNEIADMVGIKSASIDALLTQLVKKNVLLKEAGRLGIFTLNPYIFGKGQWKNISKLRTMIEYDFNTGIKRVAYEADYNEADKDDLIEKLLANKDELLRYLENREG